MKDYSILDKKEVLKEFKTTNNGLDNKEAIKRLKTYGKNELPKEKRKNVFQLFIGSLNDPIIYVLIVAVILSFIAGEKLDAFAIIFIIMVDAIVSTIQEYRADKNSEALKNLIKVRTKVIRNNKPIEIDSSLVVPGDIIVIEPGVNVSSDIRILSCSNLTIDESILTGESIAVTKNDKIEKSNEISKSNMLYAGTSVLTGRAIGVVVGTALNTEVGKIALKVTSTEESKSPLTIKMEKFSKQITFVIIIIAIIIAIILIYKKYGALEIFLDVVALSVSAMPEGLPLALTMALTIGSNRMGKRNVVVKKLNSVESLGSCTVIASDKTGTLTVNEQTAKKIVLPDDSIYEISGTGYNDDGFITSSINSDIKKAKLIAKLGMLNNEATLEKVNNKWKKFGDSIDIAFLSLAYKLKVNINDYKKIFEIPYESEKKYSAVFYKEKDKIRVTVKGSLETILEFCDTSLINGTKKKINIEQINKQNEELATNGYRVIAICDGEITKKEEYTSKDLKKLSFIGLVAFIDPVRPEAIKAIKKCNSAGIKVIMITGDHALTAYSIGKELGIANNKNEVVTGNDLTFYEEDEQSFDDFIKTKSIFARVTPIQKLKIVNALERNGEFVAVTGDGVNDAPAIKAANIGVSMGSGTDVAKETSKMIIIDDNFASIVAGIEEGRNAYANIRKISIMLLSCGLAEVLFFVLSILFDLEIPLVAIQLLWLNLVTDGLQDIALSFEKEGESLMKNKPRSTKESLFEKQLIIQILISGLYIGLLIFCVWYYLTKVISMDVTYARGYVLALMVFIQNIHVLSCRSETMSVFSNKYKRNLFVIFTIIGTITLQMIVMEVPFLSQFLQVKNIPFIHLIILFLISLSVLIVMEVYKYIRRRR